MLTAFHVSPGAPTTGPEAALGQRPVRRLCARAQPRIRALVSGERALRFRTPRASASSRGKDEPPGSPRPPRRRSRSTASQVSPPEPATGPEPWTGKAPVRAWLSVSPLQDLLDRQTR
jgi:hypothetical protein